MNFIDLTFPKETRLARTMAGWATSVLFCLWIGPAVMADEVDDGPAISPSAADTLVRKSYECMQQGRYKQAIDLQTQALQVDKNSVSARRYMGYCLLQLGDSAGAARQLTLVRSSTTSTSLDFFMLGKALMGIRNFADAKDAFEHAVALDPAMLPAQKELRRAKRGELGLPLDDKTASRSAEQTNVHEIQRSNATVGTAKIVAPVSLNVLAEQRQKRMAASQQIPSGNNKALNPFSDFKGVSKSMAPVSSKSTSKMEK